MDVLLVGVFLVVQFGLLILTLALKGMMWAFFAAMTGLVLVVQIAVDGGITYLSGNVVQTIGISGLNFFVFLVPVILEFMLMIYIWESK